MSRAHGIDVWRRDPGAPFDDLGREQYAQARARGGTVPASANEAGVAKSSAIAFEKHPAMRERIRELRQGAQTFVGVSVGWILGELKKNAQLARDEGQLKSSNEALKLMYDIVRTDPNVANQMARALPPSASPKAIKKQLLASLQSELNGGAVDTVSEPVEATLSAESGESEEDDAAAE